MTIPDIAGEAESLLRALRGVRNVSIHASSAGIESIHVVATDDEAARFMTAHVRSALLAGLAAPVVPGRIHVRVADDESPDSDPALDLEIEDADDTPPEPPLRDRIRLLHDAAEGRPDAPDAVGTGAPAEAATPPAAEGQDSAPEPPPSIVERPRLVAVDVDRAGDGRVVCRVAIAYRTCVHRAEAVAVDLPGAAAQAAAQATVRALLDAGIPGLELSGLREVEIAGRDYVLVALRRTDPYTRTRSGSAPIIGSPERSAAEATVAAAHDME